LRDWLAGIDAVSGIEPVPASVDASFRRYFRLTGDDASYIAMDAPPPQEDCRPFIEVAGYLESIGLNAPRVLAQHSGRGFLLLTDLGSRQYLDALEEEPGLADELYADAVDALVTMQQAGDRFKQHLPPYDEALLRFEMSLFHDWLCERHLGIVLDAGDEARWKALTDLLVDNALRQPQVFVHRDYHSRNLMVTDADNPGVLDFQDAVEGPFTYDLVSLLRDCYVCWPADRVAAWRSRFYKMLTDDIKAQVDDATFIRHFDLMGVQRHLKAAGIFARLWHRDGKDRYLGDVPRTLSYITALEAEYDELEFITGLVRKRCLPALEALR